jgi:hypothetical protein
MGTPKKVATVLFAGTLALTMGALTAPDTAHAAAETVTASNATPIAPPDGNLAGATSTVAVSGHTGHITDLNVTLKSVTSTFPGDLDVALTGPNGKSVMLISDICGTTDWTARDITIDDEAGATFECNLDGLGWNPCTSPKKLKKLSVGKHTFQVRATDAAKNVGVPAKVSWKVKPKH